MMFRTLLFTLSLLPCLTANVFANNVTTADTQIGNLYTLKGLITVYQSVYDIEHDMPYASVDELVPPNTSDTQRFHGARLFIRGNDQYLYFTQPVTPNGTLTRDDIDDVLRFQAIEGLCATINNAHTEFHCAHATAPFSPDLPRADAPVAIGESVHVWMQIR